MKSAWLSLILHEGLGFPEETTSLQSTASINGRSVQWPLGALLYYTRYLPLRLEHRPTCTCAAALYTCRYMYGPLLSLSLSHTHTDTHTHTCAHTHTHTHTHTHREVQIQQQQQQQRTPPLSNWDITWTHVSSLTESPFALPLLVVIIVIIILLVSGHRRPGARFLNSPIIRLPKSVSQGSLLRLHRRNSSVTNISSYMTRNISSSRLGSGNGGGLMV